MLVLISIRTNNRTIKSSGSLTEQYIHQLTSIAFIELLGTAAGCIVPKGEQL